MASEQSSASAGSETLEQTKQQIRGLVGEIAQLSKGQLAAEEYYPAFLQRVVSALAAVGGAVWLIGDDRRPRLSYQINVSETLLDPEQEDATQHMRLIHQILRTREPQLIPPLSSTGDESAGGNPTRYLLIVAPLMNEGRVEGLVEVFQRADVQPATQRGYVRFLVQMCELASEWYKSQQLKVFSDRHDLWSQADHFARVVHESLDVRDVAYLIANEGRRLIGCDRVSVAIKRGRKCKIESISGQDTIENRSNIVNALNGLSTRVVAMGEPLWFEGITDDLPPQVEKALDHYVDESYAKSVFVLPLRKPGVANNPRHNPTGEDDENVEREAIGALIIEQIETALPREVIEPRIDLVYEHSARSVANAMQHSNMFLMPVWRTLGKATWVIRGRTLPKTLFVAALVLLSIIALCTVPKDLEMKANGQLQPLDRRDVFVDVDGEVVDVLVKHGDRVQADQPLIQLRNTELMVRLADVAGRRKSTHEQLLSVENLRRERNLSREEQNRLSGQRAELIQRLNSLDQQHALLQEKRDRLTIRSPIAGEVITWDVDNLLRFRPVTTGQVLMTVADTGPDADWQLVLRMPEKRMNPIDTARETIEPDLRVKYILKSDPNTTRYGKLAEIHRNTAMHEDAGHIVKVKVDIDQSDLVDPRPGTEVIADVYTGRAPIGYVWLREAIQWVRIHILF